MLNFTELMAADDYLNLIEVRACSVRWMRNINYVST